MNRADRMRLLAALEATAGVIRSELKAEAAATFAQDGMAPSWAAEGVTVTGSLIHDCLEVVDEDELMAFLVKEHPDWVMTVVVPRNPDHLRKWLKEQAALGPIDSAVGKLKPGQHAAGKAAIPGTVWVKGGGFKTVSVTVEASTKKRLAELAKQALEGEVPPELGTLFEGRAALES